MKHAKRVGALICVISICFTLMCAPSAHAVGALGGQAAGAWIAAGLVALNIVAHTGAQAIGSYFGWQEAPSAQSILNYAFPNSTAVISDYMNASTVVVRQGVTTIDGVEYDEVFVEPGTFTNGLKTNLFDFKTKWNILSGQSGIVLAEGYGFADGVPIYQVGNQKKSQSFIFQPGTNSYNYYSVFNTTVGVNGSSNSLSSSVTFSNGQSIGSYKSSKPSGYDKALGYILANNTGQYQWLIGMYNPSTGGFTNAAYLNVPSSLINIQSFRYDYVSGVVPGEQTDIPENYGLSIQIPHDQLQTFYNTYPQYNVDNSVININEDQIDIDQLTQAIFDQITSMEDIKSEWKAPEEPVPPEPEPPGPAEDVLTGVNTIIGQQNTQISQNQQDLQIQQQQLQQQQQQLQQQQQINENIGDIKNSLENATQTPSAEELPDFKFDLRELFPFCIPFDIYRLLSSFDAEPQAPHVQLPIVIESINFRYNLDLDFSAWNPVAQAMRTAELIVYAIGLAWATGKVIKW